MRRETSFHLRASSAPLASDGKCFPIRPAILRIPDPRRGATHGLKADDSIGGNPSGTNPVEAGVRARACREIRAESIRWRGLARHALTALILIVFARWRNSFYTSKPRTKRGICERSLDERVRSARFGSLANAAV